MMTKTYGKRFSIYGLDIQATDALLLSTLGLFSLLTFLFHHRITNWFISFLLNICFALIYLILIFLTQKISSKIGKFLLRTTSVQLMFAALFFIVHKLQLIFHTTWNDQAIMNFEFSILGIQPTVWLQQFISPGLTEWLMFSYVIYIPIYPVLAAIIYFKHGKTQLEDYFFALGLVNVFCDIGFILYPVASPMHKISHLFTVPLDGYFFTWIGEFIRSHLHSIGGALPSPHSAVATVMWLMSFRYYRPSFYILSPIIVSLYISTVYCRYHYVTDTIIGIITAFLVFLISPYILKAWNHLGKRIQPQEI